MCNSVTLAIQVSYPDRAHERERHLLYDSALVWIHCSSVEVDPQTNRRRRWFFSQGYQVWQTTLSWVCTQCALSIRLHCMLQVPMIVMARNIGLSLPVLWRFCSLAWLCFADMSDIWYEALGCIQKYIYIVLLYMYICLHYSMFIVVCLIYQFTFIAVCHSYP